MSLKSKDSYLRRTYGISLEDFNKLRRKQRYRCPICLRHETEFGTFCVDHDHHTMILRGLLCKYCNHRVVGRHRDPELLLRVSKYLRKDTGFIVPKKKRKRK